MAFLSRAWGRRGSDKTIQMRNNDALCGLWLLFVGGLGRPWFVDDRSPLGRSHQ